MLKSNPFTTHTTALRSRHPVASGNVARARQITRSELDALFRKELDAMSCSMLESPGKTANSSTRLHRKV